MPVGGQVFPLEGLPHAHLHSRCGRQEGGEEGAPGPRPDSDQYLHGCQPELRRTDRDVEIPDGFADRLQGPAAQQRSQQDPQARAEDSQHRPLGQHETKNASGRRAQGSEDSPGVPPSNHVHAHRVVNDEDSNEQRDVAQDRQVQPKRRHQPLRLAAATLRTVHREISGKNGPDPFGQGVERLAFLGQNIDAVQFSDSPEGFLRGGDVHQGHLPVQGQSRGGAAARGTKKALDGQCPLALGAEHDQRISTLQAVPPGEAVGHEYGCWRKEPLQDLLYRGGWVCRVCRERVIAERLFREDIDSQNQQRRAGWIAGARPVLSLPGRLPGLGLFRKGGGRDLENRAGQADTLDLSHLGEQLFVQWLPERRHLQCGASGHRIERSPKSGDRALVGQANGQENAYTDCNPGHRQNGPRGVLTERTKAHSPDEKSAGTQGKRLSRARFLIHGERGFILHHRSIPEVYGPVGLDGDFRAVSRQQDRQGAVLS